MTQVKEWTKERLNIALSKLMGRTEPTAVMVNYDMISKYCEDPAASLEVQAKAIEVSADKYVSNLDGIINPIAMQNNWRNHEIAHLLTGSPRERAEAAYITLSSKQ